MVLLTDFPEKRAEPMIIDRDSNRRSYARFSPEAGGVVKIAYVEFVKVKAISNRFSPCLKVP